MSRGSNQYVIMRLSYLLSWTRRSTQADCCDGKAAGNSPPSGESAQAVGTGEDLLNRQYIIYFYFCICAMSVPMHKRDGRCVGLSTVDADVVRVNW